MTTKDAAVTDNRGRSHPALIVTCPVCANDAFHIFDVFGHNHLQCTGCRTTFCQRANKCSLESKNNGRH